MDMDIN